MKDFYDYSIGQNVYYNFFSACIVLDRKDGLYLVKPYCDRAIWCKSSDLRAV